MSAAKLRTLLALVASSVCVFWPAAPIVAAPPPPVALADRSTLSVLRGDGQFSAQARGPVVAAIDGQEVAVGDRVITGADANLMLTFFEGSTFALSPGTDVVVQRMGGAMGGDGGNRDIAIQLNLGTIWARVVSFGKPSATFQVTSQSAVAVVRGSQIGARVLPDGTFQCWTREGLMSVDTAAGQQATLIAGETVVVQPDGQIAPSRAFVPVESVLRLTAEGPVWPLVVHPHGGANGVVAPGVVVSQTFGALVEDPARDALVQRVETPANVPGEYVVVLERRDAEAPPDYHVTLSAVHVKLYLEFGDVEQKEVQTAALDGQLRPGERVGYRLVADVDRPGEQDANLLSFTLEGPFTLEQELGPARVLVSPVELELSGLG